MSRPLRVVLVGYGPVGARLVEELLPAVRDGRVELRVIGAEDEDAYNRVLVAEYAVGRAALDTLAVTETPAAIEAGVRLSIGCRVTAIEPAAHIVTLGSGERLPYDRLVLATGARANIPTLDGVDRQSRDGGGSMDASRDRRLPDGITTLRDLADAERVRSTVAARGRIVVLGAGVLGLEIALAAAAEGASVCVVHHGGYPMARNLDHRGGAVLADALRLAGIEVVAHTRAESVVYRHDDDGSRRFASLACADGKRIPGDLLLLSCGVSPRTELAALAGLPTSSGILVDETLRSWGDDDVYAIGDCAHVAARPDDMSADGVQGGPSGLIGPGWRQAEWLAARFAAAPEAIVLESGLAAERPPVMMLKSDVVDVVCAGDVEPEPWDADPAPRDERGPGHRRYVSEWADPEHGRYVKMVTRGGVLEGMVSVGMPRTGAELMLLFERGSELPADRSVLLRGDGPDDAASGAGGAMSPDETVCWCNAVTVARIHEAVDAGAGTVARVSGATRAGTGCGGCKSRIAELIERFSGSGEAVVAEF